MKLHILTPEGHDLFWTFSFQNVVLADLLVVPGDELYFTQTRTALYEAKGEETFNVLVLPGLAQKVRLNAMDGLGVTVFAPAPYESSVTDKWSGPHFGAVHCDGDMFVLAGHTFEVSL